MASRLAMALAVREGTGETRAVVRSVVNARRRVWSRGRGKGRAKGAAGVHRVQGRGVAMVNMLAMAALG